MKPQPRLPELAGMTEAGFNRVVAMIQPWDFWIHHQCTRPWGWDFPLGCPSCKAFLDNWTAWRASLPKTRNKRQRKASARRLSVDIDAVLDSQPLARLEWHHPVWIDGDTPRAESWGCESAAFSVSAVPCSACGWGVVGMGSVVGTEHACRCGGGTYVIGDHWLLSEPDKPTESPHKSASSPLADSPRTDP